ncbi:hypothetical protein VHEMI08862 [[Torrubiella] hemipterigena]|uniref:Aminoglycoside phosphotransferase domain-containing protein n=1 Tax=[Torrubiella] hemipterigena TaxID=1531966 RepID=A0A0A1TQH7_9HYPO|nr:hypothetical protein VHEMI08862 [[Torrubiella] hemipterigena]
MHIDISQTHTSIPVPEVYSYDGSSDDDIGMPYILQSRAAGRSLGSYEWSQPEQRVKGYQHREPRLPLTKKDRDKVMNQLVAILSELCDHPFDEIGSLFRDASGKYFIGECLSPSFTWQKRDSLQLDRGRYHEEHDYLKTLILAFTSHAQELSLSPHTFFAPVPDMVEYKSIDSYRAAGKRWNEFVAIGQKVDHSKNVLFYCIAGRFLLEMIPHLCLGTNKRFTLSHPDLHVGNIFVDDDFNITCIIDWSSTSSGPITEVLGTPSLGGSAAPPSASLVAAFRSGFIKRAVQVISELSRSNLWEKSNKMWYFSRLVRLLSKNDYQHLRKLFEVVYKASDKETEETKSFLSSYSKRIEQQKKCRRWSGLVFLPAKLQTQTSSLW